LTEKVVTFIHVILVLQHQITLKREILNRKSRF